MNEETNITNQICPDCNNILHSAPIYKNWSMKKIIGNNLFCSNKSCDFEKDISLLN